MQEILLSKPIGGYMELELPEKKEYYPSLIKLNTGRNALEYILIAKKYQKVYLPYFTCEVMLEPVRRLGLSYQFYSVDADMEPVIDFSLGPLDCMVYTNYFGLKQETVKRLAAEIPNLIVDNAQAFFSEPLEGVDTIYSCRKFFGVPDGAYLSLASTSERLQLESDISIGRFSHLLKSIDLGIQDGFPDFIMNNNSLSDNPVKRMSPLTEKILGGIDYEECRNARNENFGYLHKSLSSYNELKFDTSALNGPIGYPLLIDKPDLRQQLIERKIFVPTFWPNVFRWTQKKMYEFYLASNLITLPVDHRYNLSEMSQMLNVLDQLLR